VSFSFAPARTRSRLAICVVVILAAVAPSTAAAAQNEHLGDRTLHQGDSGHDVRVLQDFLTRAGYATPIAGVFGPETLHNVRRFEKAHHMTVDGVVGPQVVHALRDVAAQRAAARSRRTTGGSPGATQHLGDRTLKKGMKGHDVRVLQDYLSRAGFATPIAGVFGPQTLANVKAFEQAHGLAADGVVGPAVVGALRGSGNGSAAGGTDTQPSSSAPVGHARLLANGQAVAPADAPAAIRGVIAAGNRIATKPYLWGGGHGSWSSSGYDCSGSVSYALHGGGLIDTQLDSGSFMSWGASGHGRWITIYTNPGHAYMVVAGLRFDTSGANPSRWQSELRSNDGFVVRHPSGY
jgi:peptidoglycan hydrolase-like protein with peptidoglycan-binding domain